MRVLFIGVLLVAACSGPSDPALVFGNDTPGDLEELSSTTFARFVEVFPAQADCIGTVTLEGARELDDRARYDPASASITIRIPATAPQLEISLVHELAHHLEFSCPTHPELRAGFQTEQALEGEWFDGETWENTPSEQWATAVVELVLGRLDERARVNVSPAALAIVAAWAGGE